jgi:hypothetical protein
METLCGSPSEMPSLMEVLRGFASEMLPLEELCGLVSETLPVRR